MFSRLKSGIARTRASIGKRLRGLFAGRKLDAATIEEIETALLSADVGVSVTRAVIDRLRSAGGGRDADQLLQEVKDEMLRIISPCQAKPWDLEDLGARPYVILVIGVNGAGKTTTIGKLAARIKAAGLQPVLAAGDTFRAAAIEQLQAWGERLRVPVISQRAGADPASVIYDGLAAAQARGADVLIADTAGRLHTKGNLLSELAKIKRVLAKLDPAAPHETLMVLDATIGQNAIAQVKTFHDAIGLDSLAVTKLDGTAKGGVLFALADQLPLPIRFIGVGEDVEDLQPFDAAAFIEALFTTSETVAPEPVA
jgi:fused signal recognition particle receptor